MGRFTSMLLCGGLIVASTASCTSTSDARPQPLTTASRAGTPTATASRTTTDASSPTPTLDPSLAHLLTVIRSRGYETTSDELQRAADFDPALLALLVAKPEDMGNGFRCANVFFFSNGSYVGQDGTVCHLYPQISWGNNTEVSVVYARYATNDPTCCPTLDPKRVVFRLIHGRMAAVRGVPPRQ